MKPVFACVVMLFLTLTLGACRNRAQIDTPCPSIFMPVCGANGQTYNNECEARRAGQNRFTSGECAAASLAPGR